MMLPAIETAPLPPNDIPPALQVLFDDNPDLQGSFHVFAPYPTLQTDIVKLVEALISYLERTYAARGLDARTRALKGMIRDEMQRFGAMPEIQESKEYVLAMLQYFFENVIRLFLDGESEEDTVPTLDDLCRTHLNLTRALFDETREWPEPLRDALQHMVADVLLRSASYHYLPTNDMDPLIRAMTEDFIRGHKAFRPADVSSVGEEVVGRHVARVLKEMFCALKTFFENRDA